MAKSTQPKTVQPVRVPPHAAAGLDDALTAQPRPLSDERGSSDGAEAGLSVEPEEMATRWLSEATEQGEAIPLPRMASELTLTRGAETDEALMPPNFEYENTLWEQTVDLVTETQGAAAQLRVTPSVKEDGAQVEATPEDDPRPLTERADRRR
jgi:hypothetical protein